MPLSFSAANQPVARLSRLTIRSSDLYQFIVEAENEQGRSPLAYKLTVFFATEVLKRGRCDDGADSRPEEKIGGELCRLLLDSFGNRPFAMIFVVEYIVLHVFRDGRGYTHSLISLGYESQRAPWHALSPSYTKRERKGLKNKCLLNITKGASTGDFYFFFLRKDGLKSGDEANHRSLAFPRFALGVSLAAEVQDLDIVLPADAESVKDIP